MGYSPSCVVHILVCVMVVLVARALVVAELCRTSLEPIPQSGRWFGSTHLHCRVALSYAAVTASGPALLHSLLLSCHLSGREIALRSFFCARRSVQGIWPCWVPWNETSYWPWAYSCFNHQQYVYAAMDSRYFHCGLHARCRL